MFHSQKAIRSDQKIWWKACFYLIQDGERRKDRRVVEFKKKVIIKQQWTTSKNISTRHQHKHYNVGENNWYICMFKIQELYLSHTHTGYAVKWKVAMPSGMCKTNATTHMIYIYDVLCYQAVGCRVRTSRGTWDIVVSRTCCAVGSQLHSRGTRTWLLVLHWLARQPKLNWTAGPLEGAVSWFDLTFYIYKAVLWIIPLDLTFTLKYGQAARPVLYM